MSPFFILALIAKVKLEKFRLLYDSAFIKCLSYLFHCRIFGYLHRHLELAVLHSAEIGYHIVQLNTQSNSEKDHRCRYGNTQENAYNRLSGLSLLFKLLPGFTGTL